MSTNEAKKALIEQPARTPATTSDSQSLMTMIDRALMTPDFDVEKLSKLLEVKERWEATEARKAFVSAMNEFKANPPKITKNREVSFGQTKFKHATLDHICDVVGRALSNVGISYRWETKQENSTIYVTCILTHCLGHKESVTLTGAPDNTGSKNSIQAVGSAVTYLQRYTLLAATGMATEDQDDDAAAAGAVEGLSEAIEGLRTAPSMKELQAAFKADWANYPSKAVRAELTESYSKRKKELMEKDNG